ncbi:hypothetical protein CSUB01_06922 [Colletotrichum sublineola]|uniref:Uncharacterized protein n=1 Tax=Colletotrichum sublineola TaxID=1173701 RepID=A0A066XHC0_COLSU|nr:hypothetical protein CSUB01_06922 [Colletotrichum sublineola]
MELVNKAVVGCEEEELRSVEAVVEDTSVCVVMEFEKARVEELTDSTKDDDSEADEDSTVTDVEVEVIDPNGSCKIVGSEEETKVVGLLDSAEGDDSVLNDADTVKELMVSTEDEVLNEIDKLDSSEGIKEVDRAGKLVVKEILEESDGVGMVLDSVEDGDSRVNDANKIEVLRDSDEDEVLNELDKLDSSEGIKEVDRADELVAKKTLEDSDDVIAVPQ